jgi:hypothetical protein
MWSSCIKIQSIVREQQKCSSDHLMMIREIIAVCYENHIKHRNISCGEIGDFLMLKVVVHIVINGLLVPIVTTLPSRVNYVHLLNFI